MEVQKVEETYYAAFMQEFYPPATSVIFKNASKSWKAKGIFSPEWFRNHSGNRQTEIAVKTYTVRQIMDMKENSAVDHWAPYRYLFHIPETLPKRLDLIPPQHQNGARLHWLDSKWFTKGHWESVTELFIGESGETFFVVLGTWHVTYSRTPKTSVPLDQLIGRNWRDFVGNGWSFD